MKGLRGKREREDLLEEIFMLGISPEPLPTTPSIHEQRKRERERERREGP